MNNLRKYFQKGGLSNNLTIVEDGEYIKDNKGKVGKITNIPTHDDNELIIDNQVQKVSKGKGGQGIYNVESVLSASHENRNQSDDTYTYADEEIKIKPQDALQLAEQLNLKIKRPLGNISPSKLMDKLLESREKLVSKYKNIDKPLKSERQTNSFTANVDVLNSIPTPEDIYDFVFTNQENSKSVNEDVYAKTGIYIDSSKRGTFKAQASKMGMSVQSAASKILNAPEGRYSPEMRKKANFARNFAKQTGGEIEDLEYQTGGRNVIHNGKPMYQRKDGKIVKRGIWSNTYLSKKQQGGRLQQFPTMYGSKPVALVNTPQGVKRVDMINNRTVSMDDMFDKDSVQVQGNKAIIVKKNPLKKFIK